MKKQTIPMEHYKRRQSFAYFKSMAYPYAGVTCDVDITALYSYIKKKGYPFFLSFLWCVAQAANGVAEFRQRIEGEGVVEYDRCATSHTVAKADGTYSYCTLHSDMSLEDFLPYAMALQERAKLYGDISEDAEESCSLFFISSTPWLTYTALVQPVPDPPDSNPRMTWGKYYTREERLLMPLSVLCHHALVDGLHIADFYRLLDDTMRALIEEA